MLSSALSPARGLTGSITRTRRTRVLSVIAAVIAVVIVTVLLAVAALRVRDSVVSRASSGSRTAAAAVPESAALEAATGVRFSRVAVVADGGLITLSYVVLDAEKAQRFQSDTAHPPKLTSESRPLSTTRVSLMKQGHALREGQTYYLVYENTKGALRAGEKVGIGYGALTLAHVPVL
jgi:hypothetical protein